MMLLTIMTLGPSLPRSSCRRGFNPMRFTPMLPPRAPRTPTSIARPLHEIGVWPDLGLTRQDEA